MGKVKFIFAGKQTDAPHLWETFLNFQLRNANNNLDAK